MMTITASRRIAALAAAITLLSAQPSTTFAAQSHQNVPLANVRIIHASPDAPAVDVYLNGERWVRNARFNTVTGYVTPRAGDARLQVVPRNRSLEQGPVLVDMPVQFGAGKAYTFAIAGMADKLSAPFFFDDLNAPGKGRARVRFIHLSPDAPAVDVTLPENGNAKLALGVEFGKASDYVEIDAGTFELSVRPAGSADQVLGKRETFEAGRVYTLYATGLAGGRPRLSLLKSVDARATVARLRVIHASPDAPNVDVYADGQRLLRNVRFRQVSNYLDLLPGQYQLQVVQAGRSLQAGPVVIDAPVTVESGKIYAVAAAGKLAEIKPVVIVDDAPRPATGRGLVRVWHLSPDAPAVDVVLPDSGDAKLAANLTFGQATEYLDVAPGTSVVSIRPAGAADEVAGFRMVIAANGVHTMYITGLLDGTPAVAASVGRDR
jgi:hypothetical protein